MEPTVVAAADAVRRRPSAFTVVPALVLAGGFALFAAESSWYRIFLTIHVAAVIVWVGGGVAMTVLALAATRKQDADEMARILGYEKLLGQRVYGPASLTLLAFGFALAENHGWSYGSFWLAFGMAGWLFSTCVGMGFFGPEMARLDRLIAARGPRDPEVLRRTERALRVARVDITMLLLVVIDMIAKPSF